MNVLGMGPLEILLILLVAFIVLGPQRMVDAGRLLGKATREVRRLAEDLPSLTLEDEGPDRTKSPAARRDRGSNSGVSEEGPVGSEGPYDNSPTHDDHPVGFQPSAATEAHDDTGEETQEKA